jgi:hypothetical protein
MPRALIVAWIGVAWVAGLYFGWWSGVDGRLEIVEALTVGGLSIILGVFAVLAVRDSGEPQEK